MVLVIDQASKIWIKTNMGLGEEFAIFGLDWARIHFVENEGMAFGITLGGSYGKLALSLFRIVAVGFLIYYIRLLANARAAFGLLACFALILSGAIGNILDSAFYGVIFSETPYHTGKIAEMFPEAGGYAGFLYGKVVDMFYFPMFEGNFPGWFPFWGGDHFLFFRPVFNVADTAITVGVLSLLLFHRGFFSGKLPLDDGTFLDQNEEEVSDTVSEKEEENKGAVSSIENLDVDNEKLEDEVKASTEDLIEKDSTSEPQP